MRDHGGDIDRARTLFGGSDWIDLSTGINPIAYPVPEIPAHGYAALPTAGDTEALEAEAARAYATEADTVALNGAQAAIQLVPRMMPSGRARLVTPTYNEHAAALLEQGWTVDEVDDVQNLSGADIGVVVNPNNPDGRTWTPDALMAQSAEVGLLVVDESFADPHPDLSLAPYLPGLGERVIVLRSFGKFYGLAGLRLGFALGGPKTIARFRSLAGPWAASGPAIAVGRVALADAEWRVGTLGRLAQDTTRLDALAMAAGWRLVGGTALFRTYETGDAATTHARFARAGIWTRFFPYSRHWLRMGLPGTEAAWERVETALAGGGE